MTATKKAHEMTLVEYRKAHKPTRCFQKYTSEQRADHASSHRLGYLQRHAVGEFFYIVEHAPGLAFGTFGNAAREGHRRVIEAAMEVGLLVPEVAAAEHADLYARWKSLQVTANVA